MPLTQVKLCVNMLLLFDKDLPMPFLIFFQSKGGHYVPAAIKLFQAKLVAQLLCEILVGPQFHVPGLCKEYNLNSSDQLSRYFALSQNAHLRMEPGIIKIKLRVCLASKKTFG